MACTYQGLQFKTPLEARWAAFFDLAEWEYRTNPISVQNVQPDFRVTFQCSHSECHGSHTLLVTILPVDSVDEFKGHPAYESSKAFGVDGPGGCDGWAILGNRPAVSQWCMSHGAGGGMEEVRHWVGNAEALWVRAGSLVA